ncbi:MAG: alpha/beta hydrolase [Gammaproteobacteria bacterium]|nr:alpha/beta hydrolase [Gammaproteobacteria bacterium]
MQANLNQEHDLFERSGEYWIATEYGRHYVKIWKPINQHDAKYDTKIEPIVLFHDSLGCVALWRDFPAELANATGRTVIAYDRLGFGKSSPYPRAWTTNFINDEVELDFPALQAALGFGDFIAFGYSVGGIIAVGCAAQNQTQCKAVITLSSPALVDEGMRRGLLQAQHDFAQPNQVDRLARYHGDQATWVLSAWLDTWLSDDFSAWHVEQVASSLNCPLLVIHGDHDEYASLDHAQRILNLTHGSKELLIIKDGHHTPLRENPNLVLDITSRFLATTFG